MRWGASWDRPLEGAPRCIPGLTSVTTHRRRRGLALVQTAPARGAPRSRALKHLRLVGWDNCRVYVARPLQLREADRSRLEALTRATSVPAGSATRARIVLLAADGLANIDIADRTGTSRPTVLKWRGRYEQSGVDGLDDDPRPGRAAVIDEIAVLAETLADEEDHRASGCDALVDAADGRPAGDLVLLGRADLAQVGHPAAPRRDFQVLYRPRVGGQAARRGRVVPGSPRGAVVVSVDEKSQIQALDRTQPILPLARSLHRLRTRRIHPRESNAPCSR